MRLGIYTRKVTCPYGSHASRMSRTHTLRDMVHGTSPPLSISRVEVVLHARRPTGTNLRYRCQLDRQRVSEAKMLRLADAEEMTRSPQTSQRILLPLPLLTSWPLGLGHVGYAAQLWRRRGRTWARLVDA